MASRSPPDDYADYLMRLYGGEQVPEGDVLPAPGTWLRAPCRAQGGQPIHSLLTSIHPRNVLLQCRRGKAPS